MNAPERVWLDWPDANRGGIVYAEPPERDTQEGQTAYIRADLYEAAEAEVERLRAALQNIADSYEATSELHTSSADCAANLYDRARAALTTKVDKP